MNDVLKYKGYIATVQIDPEAGVLHGRVMGLRDVITFEVESATDLQREFEASVDDYLDFCAERGEQPDKPYSGTLSLRMDPELHRKADLAAAANDLSLNKWIEQTIAERTAEET